MGQCLEIQRAGHRHHGHQQLVLLSAGEQRLEHPCRLESQFLGGLQTIGGGLRVVLVTVHTMLGAGFFQQVDGRCHGFVVRMIDEWR